MGIGSKLTFAFIAVILVIVLGHAGFTYFSDYKESRLTASTKLSSALSKMAKEFKEIEEKNRDLGFAICTDAGAMNAFNGKDKSAEAVQLKNIVNKYSVVGSITLVGQDGKVFYSTETPGKSGYQVRDRSSGIDYAFLHNDTYMGITSFLPTDSVELCSMVPIRQNQRVLGLVIVSQPINTEFLTGLSTKLALDDEHLSGIDFALLSKKDGKLQALTQGLTNPATGGPYVQDLKNKGDAATVRPKSEKDLADFLHIQGYETGGRWWSPIIFSDNPNNRAERPSDKVATLLLTTPVTDLKGQLSSIVILALVTGAAGLAVALLFSAGISRDVNEPLRYLIDRTNELAGNHSEIPPLEGLGGEWLELGELIDTAVHSMRSSMQSAKMQLNRQLAQVQDNQRAAEDATQQLDSLNRQFSNQAKQLTEVSKQINSANRQSILLQHKLETILQVSTEGFLVLDQFGSILSANPIILNWLGATEGEIAGRLCFDVVKKPGEPRGNEREARALAMPSKDPNDLINNFFPEGVIWHKTEDKAVSVLAHLQPILSEQANIQGYVMVLRDKSLRSEIAQLRNEIVSMLSESIRAPLAMAETQWLMVLNNAANSMHPSMAHTVSDLHQRHEQLLGVVDSLLMMYGGFVPQPVPVRESIIVTRLVAECLEQVSGLARERQLALDYKSVTGLPNITGKRESVKEILVQVLEKMISVTSPGGRVRVESVARGNEMRIGVSSSGPSLPDTEIADMFAGFIEGKHQEDTYSSRFAMYLARNNVERIGGKIWAESESGRGTVIFFILPMS